MSRNECRSVTKSKEKMNAIVFPDYNDYDTRQIARIVKHYQELRSAVEVVATRFDRVSGNDSKNGKEEILCALVDVDRAMTQLSPRQRAVIGMLEQGYQCEEICSMLGIGIATVKFHARQGIFRLAAYLSSH